MTLTNYVTTNYTPTITEEELLEGGATFEDDDCRQQYYLHRLEGLSHEEALKRSTVGRAQPLHSNSTQRGPTDATGKRPITIAFLAEAEWTPRGWMGTFDHLVSVTQDTRTIEEFEEADALTERVSRALDQLLPTEREVIARIYGLDGHPGDETYEEIAEALNRTRGSIAQFGWRARRKLHALLLEETP